MAAAFLDIDRALPVIRLPASSRRLPWPASASGPRRSRPGSSGAELLATAFQSDYGWTWTVEQALAATRTSAFVVVCGRTGEVVCERYFNGCARGTAHLLQSVSKSVVATVAAEVFARGSSRGNSQRRSSSGAADSSGSGSTDGLDAP